MAPSLSEQENPAAQLTLGLVGPRLISVHCPLQGWLVLKGLKTQNSSPRMAYSIKIFH